MENFVIKSKPSNKNVGKLKAAWGFIRQIDFSGKYSGTDPNFDPGIYGLELGATFYVNYTGIDASSIQEAVDEIEKQLGEGDVIDEIIFLGHGRAGGMQVGDG